MIRRILILSLALLYIFLSGRGVFALSASDQNRINGDTLYYDSGQTQSCSQAGTGPVTPGGTTLNSMVWNPSPPVKAPYYLESLIINILEDIAKAKGITESDTVTQEHVVALVAWAYAEGGNIANTNADFNIWNAGYLGPAFSSLYVGGTGNSNGTQTSFASFNDGVEGNAINLTGSNQNRIGDILSQPDSTAEQVMHAIAYYDETPGNAAWAWGPTPDVPASVLAYNHTTYINSLLSNLSIIRQNYTQEASVLIGANQEGQNHVAASVLKFSGGSANPKSVNICGNPTTANCVASSGSSITGVAAILCEAEKYTGIYYSYGGGHDGYANFRAACPEASISGAAASSTVADPGPCATDCSGLISMAVDAVYNQTFDWTVSTSDGTMDQSSDWKSVPFSQAQPGDIVTHFGGGDGHVEIIQSISGNLVTTFGSHYTTTQTSTSPSGTMDYWNGGVWQYVGPGAN